MADVLVTGGAGFIGSHLVDALLTAGRSVIVLDDFSSGRRENLPGQGPEPKLDPRLVPDSEAASNGAAAVARLRIVRGDIRDQALLDELAADADIGTVVHLAAIASVARSIETPLETLSVNTEGSVQLALWAARSLPSLERFVFASSAAVYGGRVTVPTHESAPGVPDSPYGLEKATVERYLAWLHASEGLPAVAARFFNVFGPRQDPSSPYSGVLSILSRAVREGRPFVVHGDGQQSRDFVYVADVVSALSTLSHDDRAVGGTFNVGTGCEASLNDVVATVQDVARRRLEVQHGPPRSGDIRRSVADADAIRELGWAPRWTLQEGLEALMRASAERPSGGADGGTRAFGTENSATSRDRGAEPHR